MSDLSNDNSASDTSFEEQQLSTPKAKSKPLAKLYQGKSAVGVAQTFIQRIFSPSPNREVAHDRDSEDEYSSSVKVEPPSQEPTQSTINQREPLCVQIDAQQNLNEQREMAQLNAEFINQRALHLLLLVPIFTGQPGVRFDNWVRHVNNILEPTAWLNADKIRALADRLSGPAYDVYESVKTANITYENLVNEIKNRYHGQETSAFYQREFEDRIRKPGESIPDYAYSLKNLF